MVLCKWENVTLVLQGRDYMKKYSLKGDDKKFILNMLSLNKVPGHIKETIKART